MIPIRLRRGFYLVALFVILVLWTVFGNSTAIEAPYVGF